jgi:RNA polymerase-binding transcription factor DksA
MKARKLTESELLVRPHAEYCIEAQERHEKRERQRG